MDIYNLDKALTQKLKNSILDRVCESSTGRLIVPHDIVMRVKKELNLNEDNWDTRCKIIEFYNYKLGA